MGEVVVGSKFESYEPYSENSRLDTFFFNEIGTNKEYGILFTVIKLCLSLSHGQATVERGFSLNTNLIVENLQEESIVAQRIVHDNISFNGGVLEIPLTKELLISVKGSHQKYLASLNAKKEDSKREKQKKKVREETEDLAKKRSIVQMRSQV